MTMKRRIFISNTAMVLISLLILFGIGGISVLLFKEEFMKIIEQSAQLPDETYEVELCLKGQQDEPKDWEKLSQELAKYEFELYVSDLEENCIYSNAKHSEKECIEELKGGEFDTQAVRLYRMENIVIARCTVEKDQNTYMVYAAYSPQEWLPLGIDRGVFEMFIIVFLVAGIIIIAGLLICCQIFTRRMIRQIMKPVDELNRAAVRINDGNLEEPIVYDAPDEFKEVCDTFNQMQQHLKEGIERSAKYEKARTEMISGISHDLRTPLTSVKGFIKGMLDGVANTPQKQEQYLRISYQKACDMEILLQKLFFVSKLETGNMPFFRQQVDLSDWLLDYVKEKQEESAQKGYDIHLDERTNACPVQIDTEQTKRVFDNLIENSMKYAQTDELSIKITVEETDDGIGVTFADNGAGIAPEKLPYVFDQFYRGDESRSTQKDGSGLGLYICKYIIEQQGGTITARNVDGFVVEIRLPKADEKLEG